MTNPVTPLLWGDDSLMVLDQRRLPDKQKYIRCTTPEHVAECIRTLAVRRARDRARGGVRDGARG
jgi:methylthioribose-1-phosphate isomerase